MATQFENLYRLRKVADNDSKACYICYKPTNCVLITLDQIDYFYVCSTHLKDTKAFCSPVYGSDREEVRNELRKLEDRQRNLDLLIKEKSGTWNKIMGWGSKKGTDEKKDSKDSKDSKEEPSQPKSGKEKSLEELRKELNDLIKERRGAEEKLNQIEQNVKQFILNKDIYKMRLNKQRKKVVAQKRTEQILVPDFFPSIPDNLK